MKWFRTILVLALAVLWLPASVHCQLEQLPGLEFLSLSCCEHEDAAAPHSDEDCEADGCAVVESGLYKTEERQASLPAPELLFVSFTFSPLPEAMPRDLDCAFADGIAPPELRRVWQFRSRAALPPRAPSLVS